MKPAATFPSLTSPSPHDLIAATAATYWARSVVFRDDVELVGLQTGQQRDAPPQCPPENTSVLNGIIATCMRISRAWTRPRASTACRPMALVVEVFGSSISSWWLE